VQASEIKDIKDWRDPLAAIVMYTFDLAMLSPAHAADENFYYRLNKVGSGRNSQGKNCAEQWAPFTIC
jgi:hypothetical protein